MKCRRGIREAHRALVLTVTLLGTAAVAGVGGAHAGSPAIVPDETCDAADCPMTR